MLKLIVIEAVFDLRNNRIVIDEEAENVNVFLVGELDSFVDDNPRQQKVEQLLFLKVHPLLTTVVVYP